jgi:hypothetical protein
MSAAKAVAVTTTLQARAASPPTSCRLLIMLGSPRARPMADSPGRADQHNATLATVWRRDHVGSAHRGRAGALLGRGGPAVGRRHERRRDAAAIGRDRRAHVERAARSERPLSYQRISARVV